MAITQGSFDLVFDAIKSALEAYNSTQAPSDQYTLYTDFYRTLQASATGAMVFLYLGSIVPGERITHGYDEQTVTYYIDMLVKVPGQSGTTYTRADEAAGIRFRLLVSQIMQALEGSDNFNFGLPNGTIGKREFRIDPLSPEQQIGEQNVAAGRLTLTCTTCYRAEEIDGLDLDSILITADKWSALIEP